MTDTGNSFIFWIINEEKATKRDQVMKLTSEGYWVWQIARMLNITECEVVALQGRA